MTVPSNNARAESAPTAPSKLGRVINFRYEILEDHRVGSRFYTYKARDRVLNRLACVKILRPDVVTDPMAIEAVMTEAQSTINLAHPGIARVYECGKDADSFFIVTEWVRGMTLNERLSRVEKIAVRETVDVAIAVAEALEHGHKNGFVHGDLRAENVMITQEGEVKVADFGIGPPSIRAMDPNGPDVHRIACSLSPEAVLGKDLVPGSDIYQLGALMYRTLTGQYAFDGASVQEVATKRLDSPPSRVQGLDIPRALEGLILKCMQPEPQARYHTATELLEDLRIVRNGLRLGRDLNWSPLDGDEPKEGGAAARPAESGQGGAALVIKPFVTAAGFALMLAVLAIILWVGLRLTNPGEVEVPNLIGATVDEATATLAEAGLEIGQQTPEPSLDVPLDMIIRQVPESGLAVKRGRSVDVIVSAGPLPVTVPKVVEAPESRARRQIEAAGLKVGKVTSEPSMTVPTGRVIAQIPEGGREAKQGADVDLVLSSGPEGNIESDTEKGSAYSPGAGNEEEPHWVNVRLELKDDPTSQRIRFVVTDALGTSVVYDELHDAGETIRRTIEVRGQYRLRVFGGERGDVLLKEYTPYPEG